MKTTNYQVGCCYTVGINVVVVGRVVGAGDGAGDGALESKIYFDYEGGKRICKFKKTIYVVGH